MCKTCKDLKFPNAVALNVVGRTRAQMNANDVRKRAFPRNFVANNQVWELSTILQKLIKIDLVRRGPKFMGKQFCGHLGFSE